MRAKPKFPERTPGVPRRSSSAMLMFLECGERYRRRYVENEKFDRVSMQAAVGIGTHEGASADNRYKIVEGKPLPAPEVVELAVTAYEDEGIERELLGEGGGCATIHERAQGKDETAGAAEAWSGAVSPRVEPALVEEPVVARIEGTELSGVIDTVTRDGKVRDLKTGRRKWNQQRVDTSIQLTTYGVLYRARFDAWPTGFVVDNLTLSKRTGWGEQHLVTSRTERDYDSLASVVKTMNGAIKSGTFLPAVPGHWRCSAKWCEYYTDCPYVAGVRERTS